LYILDNIKEFYGTTMQIIEKTSHMQETSRRIRAAGKTIAFVPTMGFLHEGHQELLRQGRSRADVLILSIFVNPTQFGPAEDFEKYPRDMDGDLKKVESVRTDIVFTPPVSEMYPEGSQTTVKVKDLPEHLCGLSRPGHFEGVATVVTKLFNIVMPHMAIFGKKDFQQLAVIRRMVADLNMDLEVIGIPTVREPDGLAMSSRNKYLNPEERKSALCLKKSIDLALDMINAGERDPEKIKASARDLISGHPFTEIDYITICDPLALEDIDILKEKALLALAVRVGKTRLIDNWEFNIK
jgi:pantoate--beta-alanine ligase